MSDTTKRLDLQFGSFACSVQGFDDPVQPVQQILQAMQNLLEETPELAASGLVFDADEIERLTGEVARRADLDEGAVEITPGLIIVRRSDDTAAAGGTGAPWDDEFFAAGDDAGEEDTDEIRLAADNAANDPGDDSGPEDAATEDAATAESGDPGYINIFAAAGAGPSAPVESDAAPVDETRSGDDDNSSAGSEETLEDSFSSRLERVARGESDEPDTDPFAAVADDGVADDGDGNRGESDERASIRDIFAERTGVTSGSIFADPMENAGADAGPGGGGSNLFASDAPAGAPGESTPARNLFANGGADENEDDGRVESLFGDAEDQPEDTETDEGYTAAGLARTAEAETVPELMVAAAAWMVLIQGQTSFTRKEVIKVFESIPGEHAKTLEACIKGFGKAVRNEQLIMIEDGVFGLSRTEMERFQRLL